MQKITVDGRQYRLTPCPEGEVLWDKSMPQIIAAIRDPQTQRNLDDPDFGCHQCGPFFGRVPILITRHNEKCAQIVLRTTLAKKGEYVRKSREVQGRSLNQWCLEVLDKESDMIKESKDKNRCTISEYEVRPLDHHGDAQDVYRFDTKDEAVAECKRLVDSGESPAAVVEKHVSKRPAHLFDNSDTYTVIAQYGSKSALAAWVCDVL